MRVCVRELLGLCIGCPRHVSSVEVPIRKNTRARFGVAECGGVPGVPVHCHSLPSFPEMPRVGPYHSLKFDGGLKGASKCLYSGPLLYRDLSIMITFRARSELSDLAVCIPRRVALSVVGVLICACNVGWFLICCLLCLPVARPALSCWSSVR